MRQVIIPLAVATDGALEALDHEGEPWERCAKLVPPRSIPCFLMHCLCLRPG